MDAQLEGLQWVVRALAQPAHIQRRLFPSFTFPADEMILEFEQFFQPESSRYTDEWSGAQYLSLRMLDDKFAALDGPAHEGMWLDEQVLEHAEWSEIRRLAGEVIRAFGWPPDEPPPSRDVA